MGNSSCIGSMAITDTIVLNVSAYGGDELKVLSAVQLLA